MESTAEIDGSDVSEVRSEDLGEKRPLEECAKDGEFDEPVAKKPRIRDGLVGNNMKKVAEIVLVLAAMGKMRGGRSPTPAEKEMMAEAREKLMKVCQAFAPKDVFPMDAFGAVIEDLGLNKLREQRLGFRPPKMSIAEKLLLTKRKMEKSEQFSINSTTYPSQQSQTKPTTAVGPSHAVRIFPSDKPTHVANATGGLQPASPSPSPSVHVSSAKSTPLPYQLPSSEVRPMPSSGLPTSNLGRESSSQELPKVERPHFRLDGRSNVSSFTPQVQANLSGVHATVKTPTWSVQPQSTSSAKIGTDNKAPTHVSVKIDGTTDTSTSNMGPQATTKPFITQTASGNLSSIHQPFHGIKTIQIPPSSNIHIEIGKIVQKLLQPQLQGHQSWTAPSRDYMNKALTCQVCKATINDVDSVFVCDACEKGFHLKCLQPSNQKGIPRSDWHCQKCLELSHGKPLPPKYGRVMRNINTTKFSSNAAALQPSSEKKMGSVDEKVSQPNTTLNDNSGLHTSQSGPIDKSSSQQTSELKTFNAKEVQGTYILSNGGKTDANSPLGNLPNNSMRTSCAASTSPSTVPSGEKSIAEKVVADVKSQAPAKSEIIMNSDECLQAPSTSQDNGQTGVPSQDGIPSNKCIDNDSDAKNEISQTEEGSSQGNTGETLVAAEHGVSLSDNLHGVDWIGDILQVVDGKTYYQSCGINGVVYKVHSHALIRYRNDKLIPSKLQAMWEDSKTKSKWVAVNLCYFPYDLPEFGRPCNSDSSEVYESVHQTTVLASLIHGSCQVLPPIKFMEARDRRNRHGMLEHDKLRPLFLCKWFYDESKRLFRDVSS